MSRLGSSPTSRLKQRSERKALKGKRQMRRSAAKSTSLTFVEPMKALSVPDLPTGRRIGKHI